MKRTILRAIAAHIAARNNCVDSGNTEWLGKHMDAIDSLARLLPSGSGFDRGTQIDKDNSRQSRIVLETAFHHMDDNGYYCGWTNHLVIITPCFEGFDVRVTGRNYRQIKDFIADTFHTALLELTEL